MFSRRVLLAVVAPLLMLSCDLTTAAENCSDSCCKKCGCTEKVKKKLCLVKTYVEVEIPLYRCSPEDAYFPCKGKVCYQQNRCDNFVSLYKPCECGTGTCKNCVVTSKGDQTCSPVCPPYRPGTLQCECHKVSGCVTLYGAKSSGTHCSRCIKRPTGETCKKIIPVVKWVAIPVCEDCCAKH